ncbi:MAG TPA: chloride channel protein [Stellaceae bacterium]|jgi:CIC family chloride channel protein|nr:chloride channel protein [Stellaceae bacterium]
MADSPTATSDDAKRDAATVQAPNLTAPVAEDDERRIGLLVLSLLALVVGVVTGFGAVVFRDLIGFIHNVFFLGQFVVRYDANVFTPASPWGPFVILAPVLGAIIVTFLVSNFAPEAKGHGVPEVMDAIYYGNGIIRPVVAVVKSLASAFAIGSGAAVGREGPIIQIGSALGSTFGQIIRMLPGERIILVAAGAGAGIASTFNTPIGGVLFAIELMMPEVSVRTFLPVALSTGAATFIGRIFFGNQPAFQVPPLAPLNVDPGSALTLCLYAVLGALTGVAAAAFVRGLHLLEDWFDKIGERYTRHVLGMLLIGVLIYALQRSFGHYYVEGVGYATIQSILSGQMSIAWVLALLFFCKLFATSVSLGSGSSGGIFSPSLFMGATIGGSFAAGLSALHLPVPINIPSFAMVGMGAMVGGGTGAAMTAVAMIFEMTRDYDIVLPMILAVAMSLGVRRLLSRENMYTMKLYRRGHFIPKALHANMFLVRPAKEVMDTDVVQLPAETSFSSFLAAPENRGRMRHIAVTSGNRIVGVLRVNTALRPATTQAPAGATPLGDFASAAYTIAHADDVMFEVIEDIWRHDAAMALVIRDNAAAIPANIVGVITKEHVADSVATSVKFYPR